MDHRLSVRDTYIRYTFSYITSTTNANLTDAKIKITFDRPNDVYREIRAPLKTDKIGVLF